MNTTAVMQPLTVAPARSWPSTSRRYLVLALASLLSSGVLVHWLKRAPAIPDLGTAGQPALAEIGAAWLRGDLLVLVRHAERCDRTAAPCIGEVAGITWQGSRTAEQMGDTFNTLGMDRTDVLTSPQVRTRQTALFMFDQPAESRGWLFDCRHTMLKDATARKVAGHNLILVTHSECIDSFEQALDTHQPQASGYASAVFVKLPDARSAPEIVGYLGSADWPLLSAEALLAR